MDKKTEDLLDELIEQVDKEKMINRLKDSNKQLEELFDDVKKANDK